MQPSGIHLPNDTECDKSFQELLPKCLKIRIRQRIYLPSTTEVKKS